MGKLRHIATFMPDPWRTADFSESVSAWKLSVKPIRGWPQRRVGEGSAT
jgi:hypothetical protein